MPLPPGFDTGAPHLGPGDLPPRPSVGAPHSAPMPPPPRPPAGAPPLHYFDAPPRDFFDRPCVAPMKIRPARRPVAAPVSSTSDTTPRRITQLKHACFRFGTRTITASGVTADHRHPHVLCLQIQPTLFDKVVQYLFGILSYLFSIFSQVLDMKLQDKFPEWFLPERIVLKSQKPDWEEEFDKELEAYHKLQPLQGTVIPRFYGTIQFNNVRTLILSDIGGHCLSVPKGAVLENEDLQLLLEQAYTAIADLGAYHADTKLDNFHLVTDNGRDKVMILDLESVGFELSKELVSRYTKSDPRWLIQQYEGRLRGMEYEGIIPPSRPLRR